MTVLDPMVSALSLRSRRRKLQLFTELLRPDESTRVVDVGVADSGFGEAPGHAFTHNFFEAMYPWPHRITAVGVTELDGFRRAFPEITAVTADGRRLPFADGEFDIALSNAVVEHIGDEEAQRDFVRELCRVTDRVFVTTPNRWFPVDVHTLRPLVHWLPGRPSIAGTRLLGPRELRSLFPYPVRLVNTGLTLIAVGPTQSLRVRSSGPRRRGYRPMMSEERARRLRGWHDRAYEGDRREETITLTHLGRTFVVPPDVYPPNPLGLGEIVLEEVKETDRVLDLGTGSGVNAILAASKASEVVAVDVNPAAVDCAKQNARLNGVDLRLDVRESDLFESVAGRFDLIVFDPPFRWFRPRDMRERGTADENYETLTSFFLEVKDSLKADGRILLSFGSSGDIDYLQHLIAQSQLRSEELRRTELVKDGFPVTYVVYRLTA